MRDGFPHMKTLADLLSRRDFAKLANQFPLLAQEPETHRNHGTMTSTSPASQPATSGGV